jgi:hypothetical protein
VNSALWFALAAVAVAWAVILCTALVIDYIRRDTE